MPFPFLEHQWLPMPSFKTYFVASVSIFISFLLRAKYVTENQTWVSTGHDIHNESDGVPMVDIHKLNISLDNQLILSYMVDDNVTRCVFINGITSFLILFAILIKRSVFGTLRPAEIANCKERMLNYFFYKFIFMFGVVRVNASADIVFWNCWFVLLGFLQIFVIFSRDRLEMFQTTGVNIQSRSHMKIISLLCCLFMVAFSLSLLCISWMNSIGMNTFFFMSAECFSVMFRVLFIVGKNPRWSGRRARGRLASDEFETNRRGSTILYYTLLTLEVADLCVELAHYLHMILWGNIFMSVASFAICMHLRFLLSEILKRIQKHRTYMWVRYYMEREYPTVTAEELKNNSDKCAICWDDMQGARKLPCGHIFHGPCLQSWLEQETSCPTCRHMLNINVSRPNNENRTFRIVSVGGAANRGHSFHFDGSRYVSWLPSFSVQVMSGGQMQLSESQIEIMTNQVLQVFPHFTATVVRADLHQTQSVNQTITNILENRLDNMEVANEQEDDTEQETATVSVDDYEDANEIGRTQPTEDEAGFPSSSTDREALLQNKKKSLMEKAKETYFQKIREKQD